MLALLALGVLNNSRDRRSRLLPPQSVRAGSAHLSSDGRCDFERKWDAVCLHPGEFRLFFRVELETFLAIFVKIRPLLEQAITRADVRRNAPSRPRGRRLSPLSMFCAYSLYVFHRFTFRRLAIEFAVSTATVQRAVWMVVDAFDAAIPLLGYGCANAQLMRYAAAVYGAAVGDVCGAIDGSPIETQRPTIASLPEGVHPDTFYSHYYAKFGLKLLATFSLTGLVMNAKIRPMSVHDSGVVGDAPGYFNPPSPAVLLGDVAFGGYPWVIIPFRDSVAMVNSAAREWNAFICPIRVRVEHGFGFLKSTFMLLQVPLPYAIRDATRMLISILKYATLMRVSYHCAEISRVLGEDAILPEELRLW